MSHGRHSFISSSEVFQKPESYDIRLYTQETFRMYASQNAVDVTLRCENNMMKALIDKFGVDVHTEPLDGDSFRAIVTACTGPTFYRWVFGWNGGIRIAGPEEVCGEYRRMLEKALASYPTREQ